MLDRFLALVSWVLLVAFVGIIVYFVGEPDLAAVAVLGMALAGYDFWRSFRQSQNGER